MTQTGVTWITIAVAFAVINLVFQVRWQRRKRKLAQDPEKCHPPKPLEEMKQAELSGRCWVCKKTTPAVAHLRMRRLHGFFDKADVVDVPIGCCPDCYREYRRQRRRQCRNVLMVIAALPIVPVACCCFGGKTEFSWQFALVIYCVALLGSLPLVVSFALLYLRHRRPPMQKILRLHPMAKQLLERYYRDMNFKLTPNGAPSNDGQSKD